MSNSCSGSAPTSLQVFANADASVPISVSLGAVCCVGTCVGFLMDSLQLLGSYRDRKQATRVLWLLGIYPFFCLTSFIVLCVPRSAFMCEFVNTLFFAFCCLKFMRLTQYYYGGPKRMLEFLQTNGTRIPLRSPPVCCCCCCLPDAAPTRRNLLRIHLLVLQFVLVPPLITFILSVVAANSMSLAVAAKELESAFLLVRTVSTTLAFYGLILVFRVSRTALSSHSIGVKFALMKMAILFGHVQVMVFNTLGTFGVIECDSLWSSASKAAWINAACLPPEMLALFLLGRRVYRPDRRPISEYAMIDGDPGGFYASGRSDSSQLTASATVKLFQER